MFGRKPRGAKKNTTGATTKILTEDGLAAGIGLDWVDVKRDSDGIQTAMEFGFRCACDNPDPFTEEQETELEGYLNVTIYSTTPGQIDESLTMNIALAGAWEVLSRHLKDISQVAAETVRTMQAV